MLLTKNIKIKINNRYIKYYQNLGYQVKGGQECEIKIEDLSKKATLLLMLNVIYVKKKKQLNIIIILKIY